MKLLSIVLLFVMTLPAMQAQDGKWKKLAEKSVAFKSETDRVSLKGDEREANWIRIKCIQGTVQIKEITINMEGGESKTYKPLTGLLNKGMATTPFKVPGNKDEKVKSVEMKYDSKGSIVTNKRAKVEVQGKLDGD
ncbi:DUF2541 domain-containing protein [Robertkochia marina]|uniref:DUF2541 domain-containing protein n=1 Tax=Robertkochia marina TaxID=1227945 RepID=A0A4S3M4V6_9FLAO|nr:DUF2541 domain-containing protein [Robertkochia marina]THD69247.1 DUF2541 domain-containing protein [Robertkochia marina]TRZ47495.1 DUF2541 domain-containing protein [Robertkochia marina]